MDEAQDWRQRRRQATIEEIKQAARAQIAEDGAGNLSLGAVARALGHEFGYHASRPRAERHGCGETRGDRRSPRRPAIPDGAGRAIGGGR